MCPSDKRKADSTVVGSIYMTCAYEAKPQTSPIFFLKGSRKNKKTIFHSRQVKETKNKLDMGLSQLTTRRGGTGAPRIWREAWRGRRRAGRLPGARGAGGPGWPGGSAAAAI